MVAMTQNQNFKSSGHRKRHSVQFSHPMDCSTPGFPVHHQLPELNQTQVHRVSDVIQPFHPLMSPIPPAFSLSKHQGLFKWVSSSYQVAKVLGLQFFFFNFFTFHFIFFPFIFISWRLITLQYCSGFAIHWHESAMDLHVFPFLISLPTFLSIPSLGASVSTSVFPINIQDWFHLR